MAHVGYVANGMTAGIRALYYGESFTAHDKRTKRGHPRYQPANGNNDTETGIWVTALLRHQQYGKWEEKRCLSEGPDCKQHEKRTILDSVRAW